MAISPKSLFLKDLSYKPFKSKDFAGISSQPDDSNSDGGGGVPPYRLIIASLPGFLTADG